MVRAQTIKLLEETNVQQNIFKQFPENTDNKKGKY